jgi:O-antigen/teichoic acid export membrane protein
MVIVLLSAPLMQAIPRIYFENLFSAELFGIFSSVAAPTVIFSVFVGSALMPFLPKLSKCYKANDGRGLSKLMLYTTGITLFLGITAFAGSLFVGEWALAILYGDDIRPWAYVLQSVIAAIVMMGILSCFINLFVAARKLKTLAIILLLGCVVCFLITPYLVARFEMEGIAYAMIAGQGVAIAVLSVLIIVMIRRMKPDTEITG